MTRKTDLTGQRFGRLLVIAEWRHDDGKLRWLCRCDCGQQGAFRPQHLADGKTKSCGCFRAAANGHHGTPAYRVWSSMLSRCTNPANKSFRHYGARGIRVCHQWEKFETFLSDMGQPSAGMSLERIDNDGDYAPGNCRWATSKEQQRNKRTNRVLTIGERRMTMTEASEVYGIKVGTIWKRLELGWADEAAACVPLRGSVAA